MEEREINDLLVLLLRLMLDGRLLQEHGLMAECARLALLKNRRIDVGHIVSCLGDVLSGHPEQIVIVATCLCPLSIALDVLDHFLGMPNDTGSPVEHLSMEIAHLSDPTRAVVLLPLIAARLHMTAFPAAFWTDGTATDFLRTVRTAKSRFPKNLASDAHMAIHRALTRIMAFLVANDPRRATLLKARLC